MDEKIKEEINYMLYTLEHYPHPEDLEWSTEQVKSLLSKIEELEERIQLAETIKEDALGYAQGHKIRAEELGKGIEEVLKWRNLDGDGISDPLRQELYKLVERKKDGL